MGGGSRASLARACDGIRVRAAHRGPGSSRARDLAGTRNHVAKDDRDVAFVRLALFTPASLRSAIGRVSKLVVQALRADGHDVQVVRPEDLSLLDSPAHPFGNDLLAWNLEPAMNAVLPK